MDTQPTTHDLMNEAREWLQYARGVTQLLAELVHETDAVECTRMALALDAIGAMTQRGMRCAAEAHARMQAVEVTALRASQLPRSGARMPAAAGSPASQLPQSL